MERINERKFYTDILKSVFPDCCVKDSDVDSITDGVSAFIDGDTIVHIAYWKGMANRVKICKFKLSGYDCVHVNILFEGTLPHNGEYIPDVPYLEAILKNHDSNNTNYYRLK